MLRAVIVVQPLDVPLIVVHPIAATEKPWSLIVVQFLGIFDRLWYIIMVSPLGYIDWL